MDEDGDLGLQNLFIENDDDLKIDLEFTTDKGNVGRVVNKFIYHLRTKKESQTRWICKLQKVCLLLN